MKNFMRLAVWLLLGFLATSIAPAMAQNPTPGSDLTHLIVNPDFDSGTAEGWEIEGATPTWTQQLAEVWNKTFDMYQVIADLPAGAYRLTVDGFYREGGNDGGVKYEAGTETINAMLYAESGSDYKETLLHSLYSVSSFSGSSQMLNGYVDGVVSAREAFNQGYYKDNKVYNIVVEEGQPLKIGIKTSGLVTHQWIIWDNFKLTYLGEPGISVYYVSINELEQKLYPYFDMNIIPSGNYYEIKDVLDYKDEHGNSTDEVVLQQVIDSMSIVLDKAQKAQDILTDFLSQTVVVTDFLGLHYPGEDDLIRAYTECLGLIEPDAKKPDGSYVFEKDLSDAILYLKVALREYRLGQPVTEGGIDFTWLMTAPNFTKEGGNTALLADASSEGWLTDNVSVKGDFRLNMINNKNCWNNHSADFTSMDVYQELEGLPAGLYSFSCYQTNDGPSLTDQHAYITAVGGTSKSLAATYSFALDENPDKGTFANAAWEGPLATGQVFVGTDGKLRVGFASTSNKDGSSGWFCITDCQLTYFGILGDDYANAMNVKIAEARILADSEMLPADMDALEAGIKVAENVDVSDNEVAQAGLEALGVVMDKAKIGISGLKQFNEAAFANAVAIADNNEENYSVLVQELMATVVINVGDLLEMDSTSSAVLPELTAQIDECISFVSGTVQKAEMVIEDMRYSQDARTKLSGVLDAESDKIRDNLASVPQAESVLDYEIKIATLSQTVEPGEGMDVTLWITNPGFDEEPYDNGWTNDGFKSNTAMLVLDEGYTGTYCTETWIAVNNRLPDRMISQTMYVPNGDYTLSAIAMGCQQGVLNIYEEDGETIKETVTITTPVKGYWFFANEDSIEVATPMIGDAPPYENQVDTNAPHSQLVTLDKIEVRNNTLTFGIKTRSSTANWVVADNFTLACLEYAVGVENVNVDNNAFFAYVEDGCIKVGETEEFIVTTIDGKIVPSFSKLVPGLYIVRAGTQVTKVMVK